MTNKKITKEVLYTELKVLQAKVDKLVDLLQENKPTPTESKPIFGTTARCLVCGKYDCPASYTNLPCPNYRLVAYTNMQFTERLTDNDPEE
jgi:hypothetical protein